MTKKDGVKLTAASMQWDTEDRRDLLSEKEGHIRDTTIYITSPLWRDMEEAFGGVVTHVKTSTDKESGEVAVAKADSKEAGAVSVRPVGSMKTAEFSFFRPLRKLELRVPESRQFNVVPFTREIEGIGTVFVFPMAERQAVPRNRKEEAAAAAGQKAPAKAATDDKAEAKTAAEPEAKD